MSDTTAPIPESRRSFEATHDEEWAVCVEAIAEVPNLVGESAPLPYFERVMFGRGPGDKSMPRLTLGRWGHAGHVPRHALDRPTTLSGKHFSFLAHENHVVFDALGRHTTYVNGSEVKSTLLADGDRIRTENELLLYVYKRPRVLAPLEHFPMEMMGPFGGPTQASEYLYGAGARYWRLMDDLALAAKTNKAILLHGETGIGKHPAAEAIHTLSRFRTGPFVDRNAPTLAEGVAIQILFGNTENWLHGRERASTGWLELANHGTLHLDEIADVPDKVQAMLLHALQERQFVVNGATKPTPLDLLVVCAMNKPLSAIRSDLLHRFHVVELPPLRERREDLGIIARELVRRAKVAGDPRADKVRNLPTVLDFLLGCELPGNIRELEHRLLAGLKDPSTLEADPLPPPPVESEEQATVRHVTALMQEHKGNRAAVERALGKTRAWVRNFLDKHGIEYQPE